MNKPTDTKTKAVDNPDDEPVPQSVLEEIEAGGHPIKVCREYRGLSREQLARAVDISEEYLARLEAGEVRGAFDAISKIAHRLRMPTDILIEQ
ncbi:helix-turn-helix transcriptional regulator [Microbaculum marinum]|uniref:Helix-turn-helix transcriptional regulator n=1 Tax=Microbaculum marinum TaxID=1764581 RepID=A0AAW9RNP1_9HYPH